MRPPVPAHSRAALLALESIPCGVSKKSMVEGAVALTAWASIPHRFMVMIPVLPESVMLTLGGNVLIFRSHSLGVLPTLHVSWLPLLLAS